MCRNIRVLFNFQPPATEQEIRAAAVQYVRKVSGTRAPSKANQESFDRAVEEITNATQTLLAGLSTDAQPKNREIEAARAKLRSARRFA
jgi:hypothetical protein